MLRAMPMLLCLIAACDGARQGMKEAPTAPAAGPIVATISPPDLWREYGGNELAADQKYKGKRIKLTGDPDAVRSDGRGAFVGFAVFASAGVSPATYKSLTDQQKKWFNEGYPHQVICYLASGAEKGATQIKDGAAVEIVGRCVGRKNDPEVPQGYVVILEGCTIPKITLKK